MLMQLAMTNVDIVFHHVNGFDFVTNHHSL